eukprot:1360268-Prorocentrum_lima.AAC.1
MSPYSGTRGVRCGGGAMFKRSHFALSSAAMLFHSSLHRCRALFSSSRLHCSPPRTRLAVRA